LRTLSAGTTAERMRPLCGTKPVGSRTMKLLAATAENANGVGILRLENELTPRNQLLP